MNYSGLLFLSGLVAFAYSGLMLHYLSGLLDLLSQKSPIHGIPKTKASVVIAFRNEEKNISKLLDSILTNSNISTIREVILVDDHSSDQTTGIIKKYADNNSLIKYLQLPEHMHGKKNALRFGIEYAREDAILTTDADCVVHPEWALHHLTLWEKNPTIFQAGIVRMSGKGFFQQVQELEFSSLIATAAGSFGTGNPILANAANMLFSKKQFMEFQKNNHTLHPSGDDMFLLEFTKKTAPEQLRFIPFNEASVVTLPAEKPGSFFQQRMRWAGKAFLFRDPFILLSGGIVFITNFMLFITGILAVAGFAHPVPFLFLFILKTIIDITLVTPYLIHIKRTRLLWFAPVLAIIYPLYAVITVLFSQILRISWKNRTLIL